MGTFLVVQWLRVHAPNGGVGGSIPSQRSRSHMMQLKQNKKDPACHMLQLISRRAK